MRLFSTCHSSIVRYVLMFSFSAPRRKHNDFRVIFSVYYRCFCRKGSVHNREYLVVVRAHSHYRRFQRGPVFLPWCLSKSLIAWLCGSVMRLNWANPFFKVKPVQQAQTNHFSTAPNQLNKTCAIVIGAYLQSLFSFRDSYFETWSTTPSAHKLLVTITTQISIRNNVRQCDLIRQLVTPVQPSIAQNKPIRLPYANYAIFYPFDGL